MFSYAAQDVNDAISTGLNHLLHVGIREDSRVGPVLVAPGPVCIEYVNPRQRVLLSPTRDANHVFHFMESLWMLSGNNEIEFPVFFNSAYGQFSDDGTTMWDSYGWRWREFFGYDQLEEIIIELRKNPQSRRCVLSMWNAAEWTADPSWSRKDGPWMQSDLLVALDGGKAVPCNTHVYFAVRDGKLNMTVMNRSNDAFWGCFGANAVHFSFLLEYMAMRIGVHMGSYFQFTNNLHTYTDKFSLEKIAQIGYESDFVGPLPELGPMLEPGFDDDLKLFMPWALQVIRSAPMQPTTTGINVLEHPVLNVPNLTTTFMQSVAVPMFLFWVYRKWKDEYSSNVCLYGIDAPDWQRACREWRDRRKK